MEHEGIYYFFKHVEGRHTLVLADSYSAHSCGGEEEIPFIPPGQCRAGRQGTHQRVDDSAASCSRANMR